MNGVRKVELELLNCRRYRYFRLLERVRFLEVFTALPLIVTSPFFPICTSVTPSDVLFITSILDVRYEPSELAILGRFRDVVVPSCRRYFSFIGLVVVVDLVDVVEDSVSFDTWKEYLLCICSVYTDLYISIYPISSVYTCRIYISPK